MPTAYDSLVVSYDSPSFTYDGYSMFNGATVEVKALIGRRQGWPIPEPTDPAYSLFTPTQLTAKGTISAPSSGSASISARAALYRGGTMLVSARARIVLNGSVSARAKIRGRASSGTTMLYSIRQAQYSAMIGSFFVQGHLVQRTVGARAKVVGVHQKTMSGLFIVTSSTPSNIQRFDFAADPSQSKIITSRAFIIKP